MLVTSPENAPLLPEMPVMATRKEGAFKDDKNTATLGTRSLEGISASLL